MSDEVFVCASCGMGLERGSVALFYANGHPYCGACTSPEGAVVAHERLHQIRTAREAYEWALKQRENGAVAADRYMRAVSEILDGEHE